MRATLAVLVVLATVTTATAQAPGEVEPQPEPTTDYDQKSSAAAVALSIGGTLGGIALVRADPTLAILGIVTGPSLGRWYNHEIGGIGMVARLGATLLVLKGLGNMDTGGCEEFYTDAECDAVMKRERDGARQLYFGMALWGAATLYDYVEAARGSERYNEAHRRIQIAPTLVGRNTVGVGVGLQF